MARRPQKQNNNLLFLSALTFILVSSGSLAMHTLHQPPEEVKVIDKADKIFTSFAPLPVLAAETESEEPIFTATSIIAVDVDSGVTLYEKNADLQVFPASTTKIVTALVALDLYKMDEVVTIVPLHTVGQKIGLMTGEQLTVRDLLKAMLIYSANDAAEALADHHPEGREVFVEAMNRKAKQLYMKDSHFTNPSGLENWQHVSTAHDLARAGANAMNDKVFSDIVGTKNTTITSVDGVHTYNLTNINKLIGTVDGVLGVKTGYTEHAKENLVTYVNRDGKRVVISLLGSDDRFGETTRLIDWIYGSYKWEEVVLP